MSLIPSRTPTPSEYAVLLVAFLVLLILAGVVALVLAFTVAADKPQISAELIHYGSWSAGLGVFFAVSLWLVRRFVD
jgi:hypothetical protein